MELTLKNFATMAAIGAVAAVSVRAFKWLMGTISATTGGAA